MIYLICFAISILVLLIVISLGNAVKPNQLLLAVILIIGNGGYLALAYSKNLEEALLANKLSYVFGIFALLIIFLTVCDMCHIFIPRLAMTILYAIQLIIFVMCCSAGYSDLFYKSVSFNESLYGAYLTKTYGIGHSIYLLMLGGYLFATIIVALYSISKKNTVSSKNVNIILTTNTLAVALYITERVIDIDFELMPVIFTVLVPINLFLIIKMQMYSAYGNYALVKEKINSSGIIMLNKKLFYMGCNECAAELFPELMEWELEKKIPGNGGRFNTYLRQPLMEFINATDRPKELCRKFEIGEEHYHCRVTKIKQGPFKSIGHMIEIENISHLLQDLKSEI